MVVEVVVETTIDVVVGGSVQGCRPIASSAGVDAVMVSAVPISIGNVVVVLVTIGVSVVAVATTCSVTGVADETTIERSGNFVGVNT
jgi:hypothetical protein